MLSKPGGKEARVELQGLAGGRGWEVHILAGFPLVFIFFLFIMIIDKVAIKAYDTKWDTFEDENDSRTCGCVGSALGEQVGGGPHPGHTEESHP